MSPTRNLLIIHTPPLQALRDWTAIAEAIRLRAPDIDVRIATNNARQPVTARWQASRPSLVFSPRAISGYQPRGGTIFAGENMDKQLQVERLHAIGVPAPKTVALAPDLALAPGEFGDFVVVKPGALGQGRDVTLVRTGVLADRIAELTDGGRRRMLAQPYIEHSQDGYPTEYRVLTMFGKVLYCAKNRWADRRRSLDEIADTDGLIASNNKTMGGRIRAIAFDQDIIALAEKASGAFPEFGVLGVDVIREPATGALHVLEVNPRGGVWHFSSGLTRKTFTPEHVHDLYTQFDALNRAADLLIEKTRAAAS